MKDRNVLLILMLALMGTIGVASGQNYLIRVNFQKEDAGYDVSALPDSGAGYVADIGEVFGDRGANGGGYSYGWSADRTGRDRNRNSTNPLVIDERYDTLNHMINSGSPASWEIEIPNGLYNLFILCGDASNNDQTNNIDVEGVVVNDPTPYDGNKNNNPTYDEYTLEFVEVTDGRLTITPLPDAQGAYPYNQKICFVDIMIGDTTYNPGPNVSVTADEKVIYLEESIQLSGLMTDAGPVDETAAGYPGGIASYYWDTESGPADAIFDPAGTVVLDPVEASVEASATVTFTTKGTYELILQASDGIVDGNDVVTVVVKSHDDDVLIGHWPFDGDAMDASINDNHGTLMGTPNVAGGMPTYVTGAIGSGAIDITDNLGLEAVDNMDPNMPHVDLGVAPELNIGKGDFTVAAWIKSTQVKGSGEVGKATIFANGADSTPGTRYCLILGEGVTGRVDFVTDQNEGNVKRVLRTSGSYLLNDDVWHFVVGTREGNELRVYRDGILDDTDTVPDDYDLTEAEGWNSRIGMIAHATGGVYKHFNGAIDDVRVYNYALPLEDPTYLDVRELAAMAALPGSIDVGPDASYQLKPGESVDLVGVITDFGAPGAVENILWETVTGPAEGVEAAIAEINSLITTATFPQFGTYTLRLSADDVNTGTVMEDEITLTIISPTCADVMAEGLRIPGDISGPNGEPDCRVDLADFAAMAADWLKCTDPQDINCEYVYAN